MKQWIPAVFAWSLLGCQAEPPPPPTKPDTLALGQDVRRLGEEVQAVNVTLIKACDAAREAHVYEVCEYKKLIRALIERLRACGRPVPEPPADLIDLATCPTTPDGWRP